MPPSILKGWIDRVLRPGVAYRFAETDGGEFRRYIHPDVVPVLHDTPGRIEGRDAYVAEMASFCEAAIIHKRQETDHRVQIYT
ncbi:MAG: NAD(P)H-dependent oxidoreductase [Methanoregula sp.]